MHRTLVLIFLAVFESSASVVSTVRAAIDAGQYSQAEAIAQQFRQTYGATPEAIEAISWLGRGALVKRDYDRATKYAQETRKLVEDQLKTRKLDADKSLPLALGASIEVESQVMMARGERSQAIGFLNTELKAWYGTSIRARIQKNIHLLSLEGRPAPQVLWTISLGPKTPALATLRGKPVLLFFWAHWCGDCKADGPVLAQLKREYAPRGLAVIAPTQHYGYAAGGEDAAPDAELRYIEQVRRQYYADLAEVPAPVSEEAFKRYGASTTPTLVLIDRLGIVRMYHPGAMTYEELKARIERVL